MFLYLEPLELEERGNVNNVTKVSWVWSRESDIGYVGQLGPGRSGRMREADE